MKTLWPSGLALLAVTEISLVGVLIVFMDLLRHSEFTWLHFVFTALFLFFPANLWARRIEVDGRYLRLKTLLETTDISLHEIEHIYLKQQERSFVLSVHYFQNGYHRSPVVSCRIDFFSRDEIKALLNELKMQNAKIHIFVDNNF